MPNSNLACPNSEKERNLESCSGSPIRSMAAEFQVSGKMIQEWIHRESSLDRVLPDSLRKSVVDATYRQAIVNRYEFGLVV